MIELSPRYLSLHDKKYMHYYAGHVKKVVSLCVTPVMNMFVSGSLDETLMIWDLRTPKCEGYVNLFGRPISAISQRGNAIAAGINSESLKLFDVRFYDKPYVTMTIEDDKSTWTDLKFSSNGHSLLLSNNESTVRLINAMHGTIKHTFNGCTNNEGHPIESCFSPDSRFIFSGSTNGRIHVWSTRTMKTVCDLRGYHPRPVQCVKFNPKYTMLASACSNLGLWTTTNKNEETEELA
ncbi:WD repeat-containing protein 82-like [Adelges cooleyi]|uniref:WD repeat-containing protein 82-like n=1 Tax=Adelges cooleyi TaxID=133065 RepID=UPI0021802DAD|nr:WD repeat-containing protein 82-like [Adelges cooleyi]